MNNSALYGQHTIASCGSTPHTTVLNSKPMTFKQHSDLVKIDPDNMLEPELKLKFKQLLLGYDEVFNPKFTGYNGAVGPFQAKVNMGPSQPPQRKGRIPQ